MKIERESKRRGGNNLDEKGIVLNVQIKLKKEDISRYLDNQYDTLAREIDNLRSDIKIIKQALKRMGITYI